MTVEKRLITASTLEFKINTDVDYEEIALIVIIDDSDIEIDRYNKSKDESVSGIILKKDTDIYEINLNLVTYEYIYYKDFKFILYDKDGNKVDESATMKMEPKGRKELYGIISKLRYDFHKLWLLSGTECALFVKNASADKCPECWDADLGQYVSSECPHCNGTGYQVGYTPVYFQARKVKSSTSQYTSEKGVNIITTAIYTTFERLNFTLESIFFDLTTREFYEVKNALTASTGGVRTSTRITAQFVPSNDARVKPLLKLLKW